MIGVTNFFRDPHVFAQLAERALTYLPTCRGAVRVWSAGCSDGSELYSVAMLAAELGVLGRCELLGTDCRPDAVERARAGVFDDAAVRGVPPDLLRRYFTRAGPAGAGALAGRAGIREAAHGAPPTCCRSASRERGT